MAAAMLAAQALPAAGVGHSTKATSLKVTGFWVPPPPLPLLVLLPPGERGERERPLAALWATISPTRLRSSNPRPVSQVRREGWKGGGGPPLNPVATEDTSVEALFRVSKAAV